MKRPVGDIRRIAIFRALQLGDLLCAVPAIRALRHAYPNAEINLIGLPWAKVFVQQFSHYLDDHIPFPGHPELPEQEFNAEGYATFIERMRQEPYDLLLQMQGNGSIVNELITQWYARQVAGFYIGERPADSSLFIPYPDHLHEIERHLSLMNHLGILSKGTDLEFPFTASDKKQFDQLDLSTQKLVCMHPGSRGTSRQWPVEYFALLADYCIEQGFSVAITGVESERPITSKLIGLIRYPVIDLTGKTTLGSLGALIQSSYYLISNCTGVSHIAAALQTPSLVISLNGEPDRWRPLNYLLHAYTDWTRIPHFELVQEKLSVHLFSKAVEEREGRLKTLLEPVIP